MSKSGKFDVDEEVVRQKLTEIDRCIDDGRFADARQTLQTVSELMAQLEEGSVLQPQFIHRSGIVAYYDQAYDKAIEILANVPKLYRDQDNPVACAEALRDLGAAHRANGDMISAEKMYTEALIFFEQHCPDDGRTADLFNNFAVLYYDTSRLAEAEEACNKALNLRRNLFGPEDRSVGQSLSALGQILISQGRLREGIFCCQSAVEVHEIALSADHPDLGESLNNLAVARYEAGEYLAAEVMQRRALQIDLAVFGPGTLEVATSLQNLAEMLAIQRKFQEAVSIHEQVLTIRRNHLPAGHANIALSLSNLANSLQEIGRNDDAEMAYEEAIAISRSVAAGKPSVDLCSDLNNYGDFVRRQKDYTKAREIFDEAVTLLPEVASGGRLHTTLLNNIADVAQRVGEHGDAKDYFGKVLRLREESLPPDHPDLAHSLSRLADAHFDAGDVVEAASLSRKAVTIVVDRLDKISAHNPVGFVSETLIAKEVLVTHAGILQRTEEHLEDKVGCELFETFQLAIATDEALAVVKMAMQHENGAPGVGETLHQVRVLKARERELMISLADMAGRSQDDLGFDRSIRLNRTLSDVRRALSLAEDDIPEAIVRSHHSERIDLQAFQRCLNPQEAVLSVLTGVRFCIILLIRPASISSHLERLPVDELEGLISEVRSSIDLSDGVRGLPSFAIEAAERLAQITLGPFLKELETTTHLISVIDGPLKGLPLSVLPVPETQVELLLDLNADYRKIEWMIDRLALTTSPSFLAVHSLRTRAGKACSEEPFIGFSAPKTKVGVFAELVRTDDQLDAIASAVGGSFTPSRSKMGTRRSDFDSHDLSNFRIVAFATHGLTAGETADLVGAHEPSLLLSGDLPEGLLLASEISLLNLDADWVILSACNTGTSKSAGAEGVSGLASAFFEAGARALLVSHWTISELSTTFLIERLFSSENPSENTRSENLQHAMRWVRDESLPAHAHPAYWGAFSIVGEGGSG